jgi:tetratricopeptide (TPR) repeat protein
MPGSPVRVYYTAFDVGCSPGGRPAAVSSILYSVSCILYPASQKHIHIGSGELSVFKILLTVLFALLLLPASILADQSAAIVFPLDRALKGDLPQWLGEGIALSLTAQLASRELKTMDRGERIRLVESLDLPPGAPLSHGSMIRVAQRAGADLVIMGTYSGVEGNLKISIQVLEVNSLKLSGEMVANGPLSALPQMENELAWLLLINNGWEKGSSRQKFQERTRRVPNTGYGNYIQSLEASGEKDQIQFLLKAVSAYRDFPEAQFRLGQLYFRKGDCGSAMPHLLMGRGDASDQLESGFMRGTCYLQGDQLSQAIQAFGSLQGSRSCEVLNNFGVAYLRKGDIALAINALMEARNLCRNDASVVLNLALLRHMQGNDVEARGILEDAVRWNPKNGLLQFLMGVVLKAQGEQDKALAATTKAKSMGINTDKLQNEDPKTWSRILSNFDMR